MPLGRSTFQTPNPDKKKPRTLGKNVRGQAKALGLPATAVAMREQSSGRLY